MQRWPGLCFLKLEFVRTLSSDPENIVIGLVRNAEATKKAFGAEVPNNLHFLKADITDVDALKVGIETPIKLLCSRNWGWSSLSQQRQRQLG